MRLATTGSLAALFCAMALPAHAQLDSRDAISLQNQILELRHEMQQNGVQPNSGGGGSMAPPVASEAPAADPNAGVATGLTPQLLGRVSTLEQQVRDMRGQIDQLTNQVQQQNAALSKQVGDLGFALQQAHPTTAGAASAAAGPAPSAMRAAPSAAPPAVRSPARRTSELALQQGNAALARRDYAAAGADAREVLSGSRSPRQGDAQFLLAQSLAGQRQYQQAATAYYDVYSHAPRSARAPDALLGVAASLLALGDRPDSCQALQKLRAEFPQPQPRVRSAAITLRGRAGCR